MADKKVREEYIKNKETKEERKAREKWEKLQEKERKQKEKEEFDKWWNNKKMSPRSRRGNKNFSHYLEFTNRTRE